MNAEGAAPRMVLLAAEGAASDGDVVSTDLDPLEQAALVPFEGYLGDLSLHVPAGPLWVTLPQADAPDALAVHWVRDGKHVVALHPDGVARTPGAALVRSRVMEQLDRLLEGAGPQDVLSRVCGALAQALDLPLVWCAVHRGRTSLAVGGRGGPEQDHVFQVMSAPEGAERLEIDVLWHLVRHGHACWARPGDPQYDARFALSREAGHTQVCAVPLGLRGSVVGGLYFYDRGDVLAARLGPLLPLLARDVGALIQVFRDREGARLLEVAMRASPAATVVLDRTGQAVWSNAAFESLTGYTADDVAGQNMTLLNLNTPEGARYETLVDQVRDSGFLQDMFEGRRKDGSRFSCRVTLNTVRNRPGHVTHIVASHEDAARAAADGAQAANIDMDWVTGLPGRQAFLSRLDGVLDRTGDRDVALLVVELTQFRRINESLGRAVGDRLLNLAGERFSTFTPTGALVEAVGRVGGDEFAVLVHGAGDAVAAGAVAEALHALCDLPVDVAEHALVPGSRIGVALAPDHGREAKVLLANAEMALRSIPATAASTTKVFSEASSARTRNALGLERDLRYAMVGNLGRGGVVTVHYQPQAGAQDMRLCGLEALVRWRHPDQGWIAPSVFVPIAESSGLIVDLGALVIDQVIGQLAVWREAGLPTVPVAVNLSASQMQDPRLLDRVQEAVDDGRLLPGELEMELTESTLMPDVERGIAVLEALGRMGVRRALDDFGTGYSSLAYLRTLPLDRLKIDGSFVDDLMEDRTAAAVVQTIVTLGRTLGLDVVAERVRSGPQAARLRELGCHVLQGSWIGPPLDGDAIPALLRSEMQQAKGA